MIYVFENPDNAATIINDVSMLSNEEKARAVAVESLPVAEVIEGKVAALRCSKSESKIWYEYVDKPVDTRPVLPASEPIAIIPQPTNAEIQENQIVLMDVIATMYEEMLTKGLV